MDKYRYYGPIMEFGKCIDDYWSGETMATSEKKAKANLAYRVKIEYGRTANARITLPGKLKIIKKGE